MLVAYKQTHGGKKDLESGYRFILELGLTILLKTFMSGLVDLVKHLDDGLVLVVGGEGEHGADQTKTRAEEGEGDAHDRPLRSARVRRPLHVGWKLVVLQSVGQAGIARRRRRGWCPP